MHNLLFKSLRQILLNQSIVFDHLHQDLSIGEQGVRVSTIELIREIDDKTGVKKSDVAQGQCIDWHRGDTAEVREEWHRAGTRFTVLGPAIFQLQWWVPIKDPDQDDPDFFKDAGLRRVM